MSWASFLVGAAAGSVGTILVRSIFKKAKGKTEKEVEEEIIGGRTEEECGPQVFYKKWARVEKTLSAYDQKRFRACMQNLEHYMRNCDDMDAIDAIGKHLLMIMEGRLSYAGSSQEIPSVLSLGVIGMCCDVVVDQIKKSAGNQIHLDLGLGSISKIRRLLHRDIKEKCVNS